MRTRGTTPVPEKVKVIRLHEVPVFTNTTLAHKKVIKDYIYTPEYRLVGV